MNRPKCDELDYIQFLVAAQAVYSNTEAARCDPRESPARPAHDAYTRLLQRQPPNLDALWKEVQGCVPLTGGMLVVDDTTLDKPYAHHMDLVSRQWSGKHKRVVWGINLISLVWTAGEARFPVDCRLYDKPHDSLGKNEHFRAMLSTAQARGFRPELVAFDSWYSSLANLKQVRECGWHWLTQLKVNRHVDPDATGNRPISEVPLDPAGRVVHLKGYGFIRVFKIVSTDGDIEYWATSRLECPLEQLTSEIKQLWHIEDAKRIAPSSSSAALSAPSIARPAPSAITSASPCAPSYAWSVIGCAPA